MFGNNEKYRQTFFRVSPLIGRAVSVREAISQCAVYKMHWFWTRLLTNPWLNIDCFKFAHKIAIISLSALNVAFQYWRQQKGFIVFHSFFPLQDVRFPETGKGYGFNQPWGLTSRLKEIKCDRRGFVILKEGEENLLLKSKKQ